MVNFLVLVFNYISASINSDLIQLLKYGEYGLTVFIDPFSEELISPPGCTMYLLIILFFLIVIIILGEESNKLNSWDIFCYYSSFIFAFVGIILISSFSKRELSDLYWSILYIFRELFEPSFFTLAPFLFYYLIYKIIKLIYNDWILFYLKDILEYNYYMTWRDGLVEQTLIIQVGKLCVILFTLIIIILIVFIVKSWRGKNK